MLRGDVQIITGGIVREHAIRVPTRCDSLTDGIVRMEEAT